jgi:putative transposase
MKGHIVGKESSGELGRCLAQNGQFLLPMVDLIEQSKMAVDELIDVLGRAQVEAVLRLSA